MSSGLGTARKNLDAVISESPIPQSQVWVFSNKREINGLKKIDKQLRIFVALPEDSGSAPTTHIVAVCSSSSRGSDIFWSPLALHTNGTDKTMTQKFKKKNKPKLS